jgi:hypothetical protein
LEDQVTLPVTFGVTPLRIAPFWPVMVAVKVADCPKTDGFVPDATEVVEVAPFTVCVSVPVLDVKLVSPEYAPLRLCVPSANVAFVQVPVPPLSMTVHTAAPPLLESVMVTVPVGVPAPGETAATVAVKVTVCPKVEGFETDVSVVEDEAWFTVCDTLPLLPPWLLSPE